MGVPTWSIAVILLLQLPRTSWEESAGDDFRVSIICFNLDTMEVTWDPAYHVGANLSLAFRYNLDPLRSCPRYVLSAGITSGCIFPARRARLEIHIRKGEVLVYNRKRLATAYRNMTFHWLEDSVQVTCPDLPYSDLVYEVQHRGARDPTWETSSENTCNVTVAGVDHQRCYDFRARVTTEESTYGHETHPSDWTPVTHWQAARRTESCQEPPAPAFPKLLVACSLLTLLTSLLLLLSLWRLRRFRNMVMPCVPDPKGSFPGLFEKHGGDFQEWISDTQHVTLMAKPEVCDPTEEALVLEHHRKGEEPEWDKDAGFPGLPREGLRGGDLVSVGGVTFMMDSDAYMTL
ncbi:cytokine receptor-like factor 2 isoform X2 [Peromyscus eremicus]|uniref:cytokine receptor-like factor 2 isoform X2 n=1 Tax=Peromyscus eremicus TaxID=42410 RepID=UPI0027DBCF21|nr:cytokine receptor-like factor 2 isoform X2 [Peromyscus eremicus]